MRRALAIDEASYGPDHPNVAIDLNNLAQLLQATNRLGEAEPLSERSLQIFLRFTQATGHEHPHLRAVLANHRGLLAAMGQDPDEISRRLSEIARPFGIAPERFARPGSPEVEVPAKRTGILAWCRRQLGRAWQRA